MNGLELNILSKEENLILDLIDKINNLQEKREALAKYIAVAKEEIPRYSNRRGNQGLNHKLKQHEQHYSFNEILKRIKNTSEKREPTIKYLQQDIHQTKKDLRNLKTRVQILELYQGSQTPLLSKNEVDDKKENFDKLLTDLPKEV